MRRTAAILLACCTGSALTATAQIQRTSDVSSVEAIIEASFDALSGPPGTPRQWERYLSLLDPDARLVSASTDAETGAPRVVRWGRDEYVRAANDYLVVSGFVDRKLGCITNQHGGLASVRCGFEGLEQTKRVERGVALYQLYHDGHRWWILSVEWDHERPGHPIPADLLSGQSNQGAEAMVLELDREWGQAYVKGDIDFVDRILAPDWRGWTDREGSDRASELAEFRAGHSKSLENIIDNARVRVYGDAAVVEARERVRYRDEAGEHWLRWHITDVFVRKDDQWRVVASHQTTLPNP